MGSAKCQECVKAGHMARDCRQGKVKAKAGKGKGAEVPNTWQGRHMARPRQEKAQARVQGRQGRSATLQMRVVCARVQILQTQLTR